MITTRITLSRKKAPKKTRRMKKIAAMAGEPESISMYIKSLQPSKVIDWKIVSMPTPILSKVVMPKFIELATVKFSLARVRLKS